jgi:hypothetical protein
VQITGNRLLVKMPRRFLSQVTGAQDALKGLGPEEDRKLLKFLWIGLNVQGEKAWARWGLSGGIVFLMNKWNEIDSDKQLLILSQADWL